MKIVVWAKRKVTLDLTCNFFTGVIFLFKDYFCGILALSGQFDSREADRQNGRGERERETEGVTSNKHPQPDSDRDLLIYLYLITTRQNKKIHLNCI